MDQLCYKAGMTRQFFLLVPLMGLFAASLIGTDAEAQKPLEQSYNANQSVQSDAPASVKPPEDGMRLRFGLGAAGGGFANSIQGVYGGLYLQLGVQFNSWFALYYQTQGLVGGYLAELSGKFAGFWYNEVLAEVTIANFLQVGAGPSIDVIKGCEAGVRNVQMEVPGTGMSVEVPEPYQGCGKEAFFWGGDARVAMALGGTGPGTRGGLVIGADGHISFFPTGNVIGFFLTLGGQIY